MLVIGILFAIPIQGSAEWWDNLGKPQYGGTITYRMAGQNPAFDNYTFIGAAQQFWFERLWANDWTLNRTVWSFAVGFTPEKYSVGLLAENWEMPDGKTIIVNIRKGVHWQDKPPVNGREFTAYDVEYHYDRMMGTGSGFTKPSPFYVAFMSNWKKVTAKDTYTVVIEFTKPSAFGFLSFLDPIALNTFEPREWVELGEEGRKDWHNAVGTGPWIRSNFSVNTSMTFNKNPNYWGHDERHPENQVPYADQLKIVIIPDTSTAMAALRAGRIDILDSLSWEQAGSLIKSNPELQQAELPTMGQAVGLRCDKVPFNDIRVRKALQMSIDRKTIAKSYYNDTVEGIPCGQLSLDFKGYYIPYEEWPQALKDEYSYNPEKAKKLLAEAGYPDGFKTNIVASSNMDSQLLQAIKAYFLDIGVDMEIDMKDWGTWRSFVGAGKHDQMFSANCGGTFPPNNLLWKFDSKEVGNYTFNKDSVYDELLRDIETTSDQAEVLRKLAEADKYILEKHWTINVLPVVTYNVYSPHFKGYSGEALGTIASWGHGHLFARLWKD